MYQIRNVGGIPTVRVKGKPVKQIDVATLFDCEGKKVWLQNNAIRDNKNGTVDVQVWLFEKKIKNG